ncbi:CRISPR-associated helicase, Cas3 family [Paracoccus pantotrophus]|nr:CRISPR-associated helicase, Cas3 family [Paracoccus pantotrophus]
MQTRPTAWGKFTPPDRWLALSQHMDDVAGCFAALIRLPLFRARLASAAGRELEEVTLERLGVLAWLHDIGKLSVIFQARALNPSLRGGHTAQGWHVFGQQGRIRKALGLPEIETWGEAAIRLRFAAFAHHGRPVACDGISPAAEWQPRDGYDPAVAAAELGAICRARFPRAFGPGPELPDTAEFQHLFAGLVALADQIGSREDFFPIDRATTPAAPANQVLSRLGVDVTELRRQLTDAAPFTLFGWPEGAAPHPVQQALADLPLAIRLAVLESETGSGKTEAAFLRFRRLFAEGLVDGLYFAVPTRAAAAQIHGRIHRAAKAAFGGECVLALPGYLKAGDAEGQALPEYRVEWDDEPDAARREARWSAETPRRFLAAPVAVGTVDQVMLAGLQVKWAHFRAATLARSYLVIDEIHASDSYMAAILSWVVGDHVARGGHALLMSATLGAAARARLLGRRKKPDPHPDYPAISWLDGRRELHVAPPVTGRSKVVEITAEPLIARTKAIAERALAAARQGARVLVIRNTVDQVTALHEAIEALDPGAPLLAVNGIRSPHHGRFAAEDRRLLDTAVERAMGKGVPAEGRIVCASQTAEQSLDIDADFLITDLCPIDVLLQRIGRLHRHQRDDRPANFIRTRCLVLLPEELAPGGALLRFGLGPGRDGGGVYPDIIGLEAVRRLIGEGAVWTIPEDNRRLVEAGTDPATLDRLAEDLGEAWQKARAIMIGLRLAGTQAGRMVLVRRQDPFTGTNEDCFLTEEKIVTRIGADRMQVPFAPDMIGPFGTAITQISVPGHWHIDGLAEMTGAEWQADGPGRLILPGARLVYDRMGLRRVGEGN